MATRKAEPGFTYEAIARAALEARRRRDGTATDQIFQEARDVLAGARGLSKRDMATLKDLWRGLVAIDFGRRLFKRCVL